MTKHAYWLLLGLLYSLFAGTATAVTISDRSQSGILLNEPLPVEVAAGVKLLQQASPMVSPDESLLALTVVNSRKQFPIRPDLRFVSPEGVPASNMGGEVWIYDIKKKNRIKVIKTDSSNWAPQWSPDSRQLAFFSDRDGQVRIWAWDRAQDKLRRVSDAVIKPRSTYDERPEWTLDSKTIVARLLPEGMTLKESFDLQRAQVPQVRGEADELTVREFSTRSARAGLYRDYELLCDFGVIDVANGQVRRFISHTLAERFHNLSPDRSLLAYNVRLPQADGSIVAQLQVVSVRDGQVKAEVPQTPGDGNECRWSPNSRYIACILDGEPDNEGGYSTSWPQQRLRMLDTQDFRWQSLDDKMPPGLFVSNGTWDARGDYLYSRIGAALWRIPLNEQTKAQPLNIPENFVWWMANDTESLWQPAGGDTLFYQRFDSRIMNSALGVWHLSKGSRRLLNTSDSLFMSLPRPLRRDGSILFEIQDAGHYPDLWTFDTRTKKAERLTVVDPEYERYGMGESRMVEWTSAQGQRLRGPLLLPAGYRAGRRYPTAIWVYGGQPVVGPTSVGLGSTPEFNFQVLATRGYAVFFPEAPQRVGTPMKDLADAVLPAVDRLVEMGVADPDRLAIMGNSYGGYCVQSLIVQTTRFKAAIMSVSFPGNLFLEYTSLPPEGVGHFKMSAQSAIDKSPWRSREQYIDNSPFFFYDKVKTPLLIQDGMSDAPSLLSGSDTTFLAFLQLGLEAEYVRYYGEGHGIGGYSNQVDFWNRRLSFLQRHLDLALDGKGAIVFDAASARSQSRQKG